VIVNAFSHSSQLSFIFSILSSISDTSISTEFHSHPRYQNIRAGTNWDFSTFTVNPNHSETEEPLGLPVPGDLCLGGELGYR
jgi:hypothetical protein